MRRATLILAFLFYTVTSAQFKNVRVDNPDIAYAPEEVTIAINPLNPSVIAAGSNLDYFYISLDSGKTWESKVLHSTYGVWGDPSVIFDHRGYIYYGHLSNPPKNGYWIDRIVVQRSTDSGKTFNNGVGIGFNNPKNQDKEWLAADISESSPYKGNIYVAWTEFDDYGSNNPQDSSRILFSYSTDEGLSWSEPLKISDKSGNCIDSDSTTEGAVPCVGPNGEVYVSWALNDVIYFDKSTDGGKTFGKDVLVAEQIGGWDVSIPGVQRCDGMPITACDISSSPFRGNIYVAWSDLRNGSDNSDIFLAKSTDKGETWSQPIKVNTDTTFRHQFFPWMTVDPTNGFIYLVFYDRRNTTGNATEVYLARSTDGGESFENFKISESPFTPSANVFMGDYINISAYGGIVRPIWTRLEGRTSPTIWTALINDEALSSLPANETIVQPKEFALQQNYPNPFNPSTVIPFSLSKTSYIEIGVVNVLGEKIKTLFKGIKNAGRHEIFFEAKNLASGVYYYYLKANGKFLTKKMVILK